MKIWASYFKHDYSFDSEVKNEIPVWSSHIERWYQLDSASFGLIEGVYHWIQQKNIPLPQAIVLASPGASILSDLDFARNGYESSQKFAHTLPNVRISPVLQWLKWFGMVLCIQKDPNSVAAGLLEAASLLNSKQTVWLLSVQSLPEGGWIHCLELSDSASRKTGFFSIEVDPTRDLNKPDLEILEWLEGLGKTSLVEGI